MSIYFDNSATTQPFPETIRAMEHAMEEGYYNPSALYGPAVEASREIARVREAFASALRVRPEEIYFTSGGTESNNLALLGYAHHLRGKAHMLVNPSEHSSVHEVFLELNRRGHQVEFLENDASGRVTPEILERHMRPDTALVSVMHVNNESGAVNDVETLAALAKQINPGCMFHSDGVQAFLKVPVPSFREIDAYSISGHKFHGPRGSGVCYLKKGAFVQQILYGGSQEGHMRPGTENGPAILGMGAALDRYLGHHQEYLDSMWAVKHRLYGNLSRIPGVRLNGPELNQGAPQILSMGFAGANAETLVNALAERGIYCGTGSACSSRAVGKNRTLTAMGVPAQYLPGTLRFSFCYNNTLEEADTVAAAMGEILMRLRRFRRR